MQQIRKMFACNPHPHISLCSKYISFTSHHPVHADSSHFKPRQCLNCSGSFPCLFEAYSLKKICRSVWQLLDHVWYLPRMWNAELWTCILVTLIIVPIRCIAIQGGTSIVLPVTGSTREYKIHWPASFLFASLVCQCADGTTKSLCLLTSIFL